WLPSASRSSAERSTGRGHVRPVLDGLALGHGSEGRRWGDRAARAIPAGRSDGDAAVVVLLPGLVVEDRSPEKREGVGVGAIDRELGELTGHGVTCGTGGDCSPLPDRRVRK